MKDVILKEEFILRSTANEQKEALEKLKKEKQEKDGK